MALQFTKRLSVLIDPSSKARAFTVAKRQSLDNFDLLVSFFGKKVAVESLGKRRKATISTA